MKKITKPTKRPQRAGSAVLTEQHLAAVVGGTEGTIISQNAWPGLNGDGGTSLSGISGVD